MAQHWHAYSYTGRSFSDGEIQKGSAYKTHEPVPPNYPPIEIKHWLARPRHHIADTFTEIDPALVWLERRLTANPPLDEEAFPARVRLEYSRSTLEQTAGNDVVYGYYTSGKYVSLALIACPRLDDPWRPDPVCPLG